MSDEEKELLSAFLLTPAYWFAAGVATGLTIASLIVIWRS